MNSARQLARVIASLVISITFGIAAAVAMVVLATPAAATDRCIPPPCATPPGKQIAAPPTCLPTSKKPEKEEAVKPTPCPSSTKPTPKPSQSSSYSARPSVSTTKPPTTPPSRDLPVTGVNVGLAVVAGLALLGVGTGLFLTARRRRPPTFTA